MDATGAHTKGVAWTEPFSALYWRIRVQSYLLLAALAVVVLLGYWLFKLGRDGSALVYVVAPGGEAIAVLDRTANRRPSPDESLHVARRFATLFFGFNSSRVHQDVAEAISLCSPALAKQLRAELAQAQFVDTIRERRIRGEVSFESAEIIKHDAHHSRVSLAGTLSIYPLAVYEGKPIEVRRLDLDLVLAVVTRNPTTRLNGLEVVRLERRSGGRDGQGAGT